MKKWNGFDFGDFEITKREILASISIIAVLLLIGFIISGKISDHLIDKNEKYNKAVKIKEQDLFEYGMRTDIGNAFVYGDLEAVDTVTYPEIGGKYMYVRKVEEHYTMHTRQVAHTTTVNGHSHTYYTTEVYWSWDYVGSEDSHVIEYSSGNEWKMLEMCEDDEKLKLPMVVAGQRRSVNFVTENGLYNILSQSRMEIARAWRRIVHDELINMRRTKGRNIAEQFEEWDHALDNIYFDEETGKLMHNSKVLLSITNPA